MKAKDLQGKKIFVVQTYVQKSGDIYFLTGMYGYCNVLSYEKETEKVIGWDVQFGEFERVKSVAALITDEKDLKRLREVYRVDPRLILN